MDQTLGKVDRRDRPARPAGHAALAGALYEVVGALGPWPVMLGFAAAHIDGRKRREVRRALFVPDAPRGVMRLPRPR